MERYDHLVFKNLGFIQIRNYDPSLCDFVKLHSNQATTRGHSFRLTKRRFNSSLGQNSFPNRATNLWNSLPSEVVHTPSINAFEARFDKFMAKQEIVYNYKATINITTVVPLLRDPPHQRPPLICDHKSKSPIIFLYKIPLLEDHPSNATNGRQFTCF